MRRRSFIGSLFAVPFLPIAPHPQSPNVKATGKLFVNLELDPEFFRQLEAAITEAIESRLEITSRREGSLQ